MTTLPTARLWHHDGDGEGRLRVLGLLLRHVEHPDDKGEKELRLLKYS